MAVQVSGCSTSTPDISPGTGAGSRLADVHVHFNWDQKETLSAEQVLEKLRQQNVGFAVVFSVPSHLAAELSHQSTLPVLPLFSPYLTPAGRHSWYSDPNVLVQVRQALQSGVFKGIGETHLISGIGPRRDNEILQGLLALAEEFDVPIVIHTEASDYRYFLPVCQKFPAVRIQWAHAGGILSPDQVGKLLDACPNVFADLSALDPWHYGGLLNEKGGLRDDWLQLLTRFDNRFMIGSDPVWNAHQIDRWYEADTGWQHYEQLTGFHRRWLKFLPEELAVKIRWTNAQRFYRQDIPKDSPTSPE